MGDFEDHNILNGSRITLVCWLGYGQGASHNIFYDARITVVGKHDYGRGRGP